MQPTSIRREQHTENGSSDKPQNITAFDIEFRPNLYLRPVDIASQCSHQLLKIRITARLKALTGRPQRSYPSHSGPPCSLWPQLSKS
jgi:hypothetical protein